MLKNRVDPFIKPDCKLMEGSSAFLLILVSWYNVVFPDIGIMQRSLNDGFGQILPAYLWPCVFMGIGLFQLWVVGSENCLVRTVSTFCASTLFLWGGLNIIVYSHDWHISLAVWGLFAMVNLHVLTRILQEMENAYEPFGTD